MKFRVDENPEEVKVAIVNGEDTLSSPRKTRMGLTLKSKLTSIAGSFFNHSPSNLSIANGNGMNTTKAMDFST